MAMAPLHLHLHFSLYYLMDDSSIYSLHFKVFDVLEVITLINKVIKLLKIF